MRLGKRPNHKRASFITKLMLRSSIGRRLDGLWIGSFDKDAEPSLQRVEAALNLIKTYDTLQYQRVIHDLERIWVTLIPGGTAHMDESIWACVLDQRFLLNEANSPERIASAIVHEATHARLSRCGIGYDKKELRARVEAVCFGRERAFAGRLPNGEQSRERIDRYLEFYANPERWTDESLRARHEEGVVKTLQYLGFPDWLQKLVRPIRSLRMKLSHVAGRP
jgi:hypothetical protein